MKQEANVRAFKNELANYQYYKDKALLLQEKIDDCYNLLPGSIHGNNPQKLPIYGGVPNKEFEYKVRDEIERYGHELSRLNDKINSIDEILLKIETPLQAAIIDKYAHGRTLEQVATNMFLSSAGLLKQINKAIKKALDD
jgi:hypothetical protein